MSVQLNVRTTKTLVDEIDNVVKQGRYRNRSEAVNDALRLFIRQYEMRKIEERMNYLAKKARGGPSLTKAVMESHDEEDM